MTALHSADGIHFGTGEDENSGWFTLAHPQSPTVLNEPEATWHYAQCQETRPEATNVWRSSPAIKPAQTGWSGHVFSRAVFEGIDEHHDRTGVYPTDILLLNELNLCFVADQRVTARRPVAGTMRRYEGDVVRIKTTSGKQVTATPNHPILTRQGWLPASQINEGTEVLEYTAGDPVLRRSQRTDDVYVPTAISEVFRSLNDRGWLMRRRPGVRVDFHGDGRDSYVDVVRPNSFLRDTLPKTPQEISFMVAGTTAMSGSFYGERSPLQFFGSDFSSPRGSVHLSQSFADGGGVVIPSLSGSASRASGPAASLELDEQIRRIGAGERVGALSPEIAFIQVANVVVSRYEGHVYNLTTEDHLIVADGIITHNCYERGDAKDDGGAFDTDPKHWPGLYSLLAGFLDQLLISCRERSRDRGFDPRYWFPAWAPGHGEYTPEIAKIWVPVAQKYDAVSLHSYTDADTITSDVLWYLQTFPDTEIFLTEWNTINLGKPNSPERYGEEVRIRSRLRELARWYAKFSACYFIYAWEQDPHHEHDIKGNKHREAIWDGRVEIPVDTWTPGPKHPPVDPVNPDLDPEPEEPPMAQTDYPLGIDISNNNGHVNMDAVAASGVQFVICKSTEGVNFVDRYLPGFWPHIKRLGMGRGAYHFARPSQNNPFDEAAWFVTNTEGYLEPGDIVALDLEDPNAYGDLSVWTLQWLQAVEIALGFKPMIYCSPSYIQERRLANKPEIGEYGLWLASWGVPTPPPAPAPWSVVAIHQTGVGVSGSQPGVSGEIDLNRFNGPIENFAKYGKPGDVPDEPPVPLEDHEHNEVVGPGILTSMHAVGDEPASDEIDSPFWTEAMGESGRIYRYVKKTNQTHTFNPV